MGRERYGVCVASVERTVCLYPVGSEVMEACAARVVATTALAPDWGFACPGCTTKSSRSAGGSTTYPTRTVTEAFNLLFSALTMNPAALHLDAE